MAFGEMSTPRIWRSAMCVESRECRRMGIQPVPEQRSRIRRGASAFLTLLSLGHWGYCRRRERIKLAR